MNQCAKPNALPKISSRNSAPKQPSALENGQFLGGKLRMEFFVLGGGELAGLEPAPYMSYNIFQLEIILLKVIRLFSLGRRHDCRLPLAGSCCQHPLGAGIRTRGTGPPRNSRQKLASRSEKNASKNVCKQFSIGAADKGMGGIHIYFSVEFSISFHFPILLKWIIFPENGKSVADKVNSCRIMISSSRNN